MTPHDQEKAFLKEKLDEELKHLHLDSNAKRQILQKMKAPKRLPEKYLGAAAAVLAAAALLLVGLSHISHEDLTDVPRHFSRPEITDRVEQAAYHAAVYSCKVGENGSIWLEYDINRTKEKVAASGDAGAMTAYGIQETDAVMHTTSDTDSKYRWEPFNGEAYPGAQEMKKTANRFYAEPVAYITGFSVVEGDRVLGTWQHDSHSLLENGKVISGYKAGETACAALAEWMAQGETVLHLRVEDVNGASTLYTDLSGTAEAADGVICTDIQIK